MRFFINYKQGISVLLASLLFLMPCFTVSSYVYAEDTIYDFSDEAQAKFDASVTTKNVIKEENPKLKPSKRSNKQTQTKPREIILEENISPDSRVNAQNLGGILIKKGEYFCAVLQSSISSASTAPDDAIAALLEVDWVHNGILIAPRGSVVYGYASDAKSAGPLLRDGFLAITFNEIVTPDGCSFKLASNIVTINAHSNKWLKFAGNTAAGAAAGILSGILYTLISGGNVASGIAAGAAVGAAGGLVTTVVQHGNDVEIQAGTPIKIELSQDMNVIPYK